MHKKLSTNAPVEMINKQKYGKVINNLLKFDKIYAVFGVKNMTLAKINKSVMHISPKPSLCGKSFYATPFPLLFKSP